ncbi:hypothetical protein T440DRAFT_4079 [Plenodomus tracheiphilus IPT5]|uniref:Uncharacterized protein n=1 Tax=Plenodomus tracheiphilus IPT5 TaxID=1408161 RepID=A0A6A7BMB1_9PLEO|nr:hypothetical protein T440DRAFT_4079 [Plenodomus tracheiphilus IPT5]
MVWQPNYFTICVHSLIHSAVTVGIVNAAAERMVKNDQADHSPHIYFELMCRDGSTMRENFVIEFKEPPTIHESVDLEGKKRSVINDKSIIVNAVRRCVEAQSTRENRSFA